MILNLPRKSLILLLLLPISLVHTSIAYQDNVPCASVSKIQASVPKLDTAQKINDKYIAYTATSAFQSNDLWWYVGVGDVIANSSDEAIKIGKDFLNNVTVQVDVFANRDGNEYICNYRPGYIQARGKKFIRSVCQIAIIMKEKNMDKTKRSIPSKDILLLDCLPGAIGWKDINFKYLGANKGLLQLKGIKDIKEIQGKTDNDVSPVAENDNALFEEQDLQVLKGEKIATIHEDITRNTIQRSNGVRLAQLYFHLFLLNIQLCKPDPVSVLFLFLFLF
jgi:hypothetical protein